MLRELPDLTERQDFVPEIAAERCVHSLTEQASCRACVDACPRQAWVIDDEMLGIDPTRCDGCDLCVPACPQDAVLRRFKPRILGNANTRAAFACCEYANTSDTEIARMPCLHGIDAKLLIDLSADGIDALITSSGDCSACARGSRVRLADLVADLADWLPRRNLPPIRHRQLDADHYVAAFRRLQQLGTEEGLHRRAFFGKLLHRPAERVEAALRDDAHGNAPLPKLPPLQPGAPALFAPTLDALVCSGCDACFSLCPQSALRIQTQSSSPPSDRPTQETNEGWSEPSPPVYRLFADRCTGCGVCVDVCEVGAIKIERRVVPRWHALPLWQFACDACGVQSHLPQAPDGQRRRLCRVCSQHNHYAGLYQVIN